MDNRTKDAVDNFSNYVNSFGLKPKDFADAVMNQHRTLQQSMFSCMIECMKSWSEMYEKERFDARNEDTCKLSNKIVKQFEDELYTRFI